MIELNKKTQKDFFNMEWVQKLLDAGVKNDFLDFIKRNRILSILLFITGLFYTISLLAAVLGLIIQLL